MSILDSLSSLVRLVTEDSSSGIHVASEADDSMAFSEAAAAAADDQEDEFFKAGSMDPLLTGGGGGESRSDAAPVIGDQSPATVRARQQEIDLWSDRSHT